MKKNYLALFLLLFAASCAHKQAPVVEKQVVTEPLKPFVPSVKPVVEQKVSGKKVAILLPLTGKNAALGAEMLNAAEMAIFDLPQKDSVVLLPKNTQGTADGAQRAAREAINDGAELILGPIFSQEVGAIKALAATNNIPVVAFTTDTNVAGGGVYAFGFLPQEQISKIAKFASANGVRHLVAVVPSNPYGAIVKTALVDAQQNGEITLVDTIEYQPGAMYQDSPELDRIKTMIKAAKTNGAQGILIPESGKSLDLIVGLLNTPETDGLKVLGSGQWEGHKVSQNPGLMGAWYAAPMEETHRKFEVKYKQIFPGNPARIVSLAYDATALAIALSKDGYSAAEITKPNGFAGVDGVFVVKPDGYTMRELAVYEVTNQGPKLRN